MINFPVARTKNHSKKPVIVVDEFTVKSIWQRVLPRKRNILVRWQLSTRIELVALTQKLFAYDLATACRIARNDPDRVKTKRHWSWIDGHFRYVHLCAGF